MNTIIRSKLGALAVAISTASLLLSGCTGTPERDARLEATSAQLASLQALSSDPSLASVELKEAQDAVARADKAVADGADAHVVNHKIYVAQRKVATAEQVYQRKVSERTLATVEEQRTTLQLQAREIEAERARRELEELKAKQSSRGMVMTLGDVMFDTGKYELKAGGLRVVEKLAAFLAENPERAVRIEGFTDSVGGDDFNQALSEKRAQSVKAQLVAVGVEPGRIATQGYGEAFPVASNDSSAGRQMNRRVEVIISNDGGEVLAR